MRTGSGRVGQSSLSLSLSLAPSLSVILEQMGKICAAAERGELYMPLKEGAACWLACSGG
jgi:hypothetical protein